MYEDDTSAEMMSGGMAEDPIQRGEPENEPADTARVTQWLDRIADAKAHWKKDFDRMRKDMQLSYAGADKDWIDDDKFTIPIINRYINQTVAALYAKNPKTVAELKRRLEFTVWDGNMQTLQAAMQSVEAATVPQVDPMMGVALPPTPIDPMAISVIQEVQQVQQRRQMLKKVCKTLEVLIGYYMDEQTPNFKKQLKKMVRRSRVCGVGYLWLAYQRIMQARPEYSAQIADLSNQIARIESLSADYAAGIYGDESENLAELQSMLADLQAMEMAIVREGPVFDFPRATEVIIDPACRELSGFVGAGWIAREMMLSVDKIKDVYKVDIGCAHTPYARKKTKDGTTVWASSDEKASAKKEAMACVWEVWDKETGQTFTVADGYSGYLVPPAAPEYPLERFWPCFALVTNEIEHENELYPLSEVHMLRHTQAEYNRSRQYRRLHREANKPKYVSVKGRLSDEDKNLLASHQPHAVIELSALNPGEAAEQLLQPFRSVPLDPALYETNSEMEDVLRTVGAQEANLGGTSGATATESSIAEGSRVSAMDAAIDDLDEFLSEVVRSTGQLMLMALDVATVKKIAGPGAEWPQLSREEIIDEIYIDIKAGSSGRPNRAAELANLERVLPYILQMRNVNTDPYSKRIAEIMDIDIDEVIVDGLPSTMALNAMMAKAAQGGVGPGASPAMQGGAGAMNTPSPVVNEQGPQPGYPAPSPVG